MHPRTRTVLEEQQQVASRGRAGAGKRWKGQSTEKTEARPTLKPSNPSADTDDKEPF